MTGAAWPAADELFRRSPRWRGSDDAYTVPLGADRTLWLFGDTFVTADGAPDRTGSTFLRNSIGIQHGLDPQTATIEFAWGESDGRPTDFFGHGEDDRRWLWPLAGIRLDARLLLFFMDVELPEGSDPYDPLGIPFRVTGWQARLVDGIDGPPDQWRQTALTGRPDTGGAIAGTALLRDDDTLYLYAFHDDAATLFRCPVAAAGRGDLTESEWWAGDTGGWTRDVGAAVDVVRPATTEFTVHRLDDGTLCLVDVAPISSPDAAVNVRFADRPEGPWSAREPVYPIPEAARPGVFVYAGKAHPELTGAGLVVTYASNSTDFPGLLRDESLYYPRFARVDLDRLDHRRGRSPSRDVETVSVTARSPGR